MSKTREEILKAKTAHEVHVWIQQNPDLFDADVGAHFNELAKKEGHEQNQRLGISDDLLWSPPDFHTKKLP